MRYFTCLLIYILCSFSLSAQDRITTIQGDEIIGKVKIIDTAFIHYALKDTTTKDSLAYSKQLQKLRKTDVFMITYANGSKDVFTQNLPEEKADEEPVKKNNANRSDNYALGEQDAKKMFDGSGAFVAGFIGLIPGAIVAVTTPKIKQSKVSDPELITDENYSSGYKKAAGNKKLKNAAAGYVVGRAVTLVFVIALLMSF